MNMMIRKQAEIALELLKHTTNVYLSDFILRYIYKIQTLKPPLDKSDEDNLQLLKFQRCIERIEHETFNFSGWHLHEIPIDGVFCFVKMENDSYLAFDLVYDKETDKVIPCYVEASELHEADSIQEAINKYIIV